MLIPRLSYPFLYRCHPLVSTRTMRERISLMTIKWCNYVQLMNGHMFHSQFPNLSACRLMTAADKNEISRSLCEVQTTGELLNFVSTVDSERWTPQLSSLLTKRLVSTHYQYLYAIYPCLHENISAASKQLILGDPVVQKDAFAPVHLHFAYKTWMNIVEYTCSSYNPDQLASTLLSATNLFVDLESSLMHRLLSETHRHLPLFGLSALAKLSNSLKCLPGNNELLVRSLLKHVQKYLDAVGSANADELLAITAVFDNLQKFLSFDFRYAFVTQLLQMIQSNKDMLLNPTCVDVLFHLARIQSFTRKHNTHALMDICVEICQEYGNKLTVSAAGKMCMLLQSCGNDHSLLRVFNILESRAHHLLSDDSRLSEVTDLMNCLSRYTSQQVTLQFFSALHSRLIRSDYVDTYSLSNIARVLCGMPTVNVDLLTIVQRLIARQANNIVLHPYLFIWIENFLSQHRFLDKDLERQFNECCLSFVQKYIGVSKKYASSVLSAYLLPVVNEGLPPSVFKNLIMSVTQWRDVRILKQSRRIGSLRGSSSLNCQLKHLNVVLYQTLCQQLDLADSLDCLHLVACCLLMHGCQQNPVVTDRIMNMYTQYSSALSDHDSADKIATIFHKVNYYLPAVYDDLVHYVVSTDNSDAENLVAKTVVACATAGYVPRRAEELVRLARCSYHKLIDQRNYELALKLLYSLTNLQLFLDNELSKLFTLEALEDVDRYMADNQEKRQLISNIENIMMFLNRTVVLDCPHLDVPWFRDKASKVFRHRGLKCKSPYNEAMAKGVLPILSKVLGGLNYVQSSSYSQHHYYVDFECLLDDHQKPIDVSRWSQAEETGNCQKIAVCVLGHNSYCYNSKHLSGFAQTKKRHLEIMNYKFLEIPHFDWFSMSLTDKKAKFDYIEKKLFR